MRCIKNNEKKICGGMELIMDEIVWKDRKRTIFGLPLSFTRYRLSKERLFIVTGFFTQHEDEVRLYRIMDVSLNRTFGQRIFGVGTIICNSSDESLKDFEIKSVKKSKEVKELLSEMIETERKAKHVTNREFMAADDEFDNTGDSLS